MYKIMQNTKHLFFKFSEDRYKVLGLELEDLQKMESFLTQLSILTEKLLLASSETKINIRNLLVWLNKSSFKTQ